MKLPLLALGLLLATAATAESGWRSSWDGTLYGYARHTDLRANSRLNPGNQIARLPERSEVAELRLNFKAEHEALRLTARAIAASCASHNRFGDQACGDAYLSQWQLRLQAAEGWHLAAGREVLNWGPAQFRSPSSPFYFDNGRSDPMRELVGMDALKVAWTPDMQRSISLVRILRSGHNSRGHGSTEPDEWRDSWLAKFDQRGDDWAYGLVAAKAPDRPGFYGAHGQLTWSDALLLYGELGSSTQAPALQTPPAQTQPFALQTPAPRRSTALAGAAYTFENGQSLAAEYLHEGHGYSPAQETAYFRRAATLPGLALGFAPRLLGRDYLHLVWQSNLMDSQGYWRLMATHNFGDGGNEIAAYAETVLSGRLTAFLLAVQPLGGARKEFSALLQRSLTLGLKIALP